jgi:UDP-glucose 4-epimerase
MAKYIVTGGAGFIGSALARALLRQGSEVMVVDNLSTGFRENIPEGAEFLEGDLGRPEVVRRLPAERVAGVLHLAGQSSGEVSFADPGYDLAANTLSTLLLLRWCKEHNVTRMMYASSMSVYGNVPDAPVREDHRAEPLAFYGVSKLASEGYLRIYAGRGVNTTALRMFNVYGPGQNMANLKQGMVSIYLAYLLRGGPIVVKGDARRFRDFVYIDDVVAAWLAALDCPATFGNVYNIAGGQRTEVAALLQRLLEAAGCRPADVPIVFADGTPGDQFGIYASIQRLRDDTGWRPRVELDEGLRRMVAWARSPAAPSARGRE